MAWRPAWWQRMIMREADPGGHRMIDRIAPDDRANGGILIDAGTGSGDRALSQLGGYVPGHDRIAATDLRQIVRVHGWEGDYG